MQRLKTFLISLTALMFFSFLIVRGTNNREIAAMKQVQNDVYNGEESTPYAVSELTSFEESISDILELIEIKAAVIEARTIFQEQEIPIREQFLEWIEPEPKEETEETVKKTNDNLEESETYREPGESVTSEEAPDEPSYPVTEGIYDLAYFEYHGVINWEGFKYTYYSQSVLPGEALDIPGRHVSEDGFVVDGDGYITLASNTYPKGTILPTPFGRDGIVRDFCEGGTANQLDVYIR